MKRVLFALMLAAGAASAQQPPVEDDETLDAVLDAEQPGYSREEARIAAFVQGANRGALAAAGVAAKNAKDPDVKAFAQHVLMSRQDLGGAFDALASWRELPSDAPRGADEFQFQGEEAARSLASLEADAHDRFFLDWAQDHSRRLKERIDENLRFATETRMKETLVKLRNAAESDEQLAEQLKRE